MLQPDLLPNARLRTAAPSAETQKQKQPDTNRRAG